MSLKSMYTLATFTVLGAVSITHAQTPSSVFVLINNETYVCSKGGASVAQCECYSNGYTYLVRVRQGDKYQDFYWLYPNLITCLKAMNSEEQYQGICTR